MTTRLLGNDFVLPSVTAQMVLAADIEGASEPQLREMSEDLAMMQEHERYAVFRSLERFSKTGNKLAQAFVRSLGNPHKLDLESTTTLAVKLLTLSSKGAIEPAPFKECFEQLVRGFQGNPRGENLLLSILRHQPSAPEGLETEGFDALFAQHLADIQSNPSSEINSPAVREWHRAHARPACLAEVIRSAMSKGNNELGALLLSVTNNTPEADTRASNVMTFLNALGEAEFLDLIHKQIGDFDPGAYESVCERLGEDQILPQTVRIKLIDNIRSRECLPPLIVSAMSSHTWKKPPLALDGLITQEIDSVMQAATNPPSSTWIERIETRTHGTRLFDALMRRLQREISDISASRPADDSTSALADALLLPMEPEQNKMMSLSNTKKRKAWTEAVIAAIDNAGMVALAPQLNGIKADTFESIWRELKHEHDNGQISRLYRQGGRAIVESEFGL